MLIDKVKQALAKAEKGEFGVTGIKIELEAQLRRGMGHGCDECDNGRVTCWTCDGSGEVYDDDEGGYDSCHECGGRGDDSCGYCSDEEVGYGSEQRCFDFIIDHVIHAVYNQNTADRIEEIGEPEEQYDVHNGSYRIDHYKLIEGVVFAEFYNDGSVDSELTFTVLPSHIELIPKFIEAFKALADEIGNGINVDGAGMHMGLLNSPMANYPHRQDWSMRAYENFKRSMTPLLPALYFLGTNNDQSRGMSYRRPRISYDDKYSAIYFSRSCMEFRVFDTCYDNPEAVLDNLYVICNAVNTYWKEEFVPSIALPAQIRFGNDHGNDLKRLYISEQHIDLLNKGIRLLKPSYYTVTDIKRQRKFNKTKSTVKAEFKRREKEAEIAYQEYENRFEWSIKTRELELSANYLRDRARLQGFNASYPLLNGTNTPDISEFDRLREEVEERVRERIQQERQEKRSLGDYIKQALNNYLEAGAQHQLR